MMAIRTIHLLVGEPALLLTRLVNGQEVANLCESDLHCVDAFWLSSRCGLYNHNFLTDDIDSNRIEIFTQTLIANYSQSLKPLLIIPDLIEYPNNISIITEKNNWINILMRIKKNIKDFDYDCNFHLHLLTLPIHNESIIRMDRLRNLLYKNGLNVKEVNVKVIQNSTQNFRLELNYLSDNLTASIKNNLVDRGIILSDSTLLSQFLYEKLVQWSKRGMQLELPINDELIERLTEAVIVEMIDCRKI